MTERNQSVCRFAQLPGEGTMMWFYNTDCHYRCFHGHLIDKVKKEETIIVHATEAVSPDGCTPCFIAVLKNFYEDYMHNVTYLHERQ